ncbi:hypothetical protein BaRGS_00001603 [Batillaria attramentaria]|uniref:C1q domain-containing protein n=1 Tax=Batillaria attramentaria TaxID=370345 RepID=A0ABD0M7C5_9CAEN
MVPPIFILVVLATTGAVSQSEASSLGRRANTTTLEDLVMQQGQLIAQLQAEVAELKTQADNRNPLVAFMTSLPANTQNLASNPVVKFGSPDLNIGDGFHTDTSKFVAPISGIYVFFIKVSGESSDWGHYITFAIKKEGTAIAETETNDSDNVDRSSVQVVVQLVEGQAVWVEKSGGAGTTMRGQGFLSTFGGFLLRAGESF